MVRKHSRASFEDEFPLYHALIVGNAAAVAALYAAGEAAKCGPGNLSVLMLALLLHKDEQLPQLIAAGAPLDVALTLGSTDVQMQNWLAAAQLTDSAVVRQEVRAVLQEKLKLGHCVLDLALSLNKWEQAELLVAAGADLQPLLQGQPCTGWCESDTCTCDRQPVRQYAVLHYSGERLHAAPAARLGQLAMLAVLDAQPEPCLAALRAAADRGVQLSTITAAAVLAHAAYDAQVDVVMHMVQHSPGSVWGLLRGIDYFRHAVAEVLFPHLAQLFVTGTLEVELQRSLPLLVKRALQASQPIAAFTVLHAVAESQRERQQLQQHQEVEEEEQQQLMLSAEDLTRLLHCAAATGHPAVALHLLQRGADVWQAFSILQAAAQEGQPAVVMYLTEHFGSELWWRLLSETGPAIHKIVLHDVAAHLLGQLTAGTLQLDSTHLGLLVVRAAACEEAQASAALMQAAAKQQVQLTSQDTFRALSNCMKEERAGLVNFAKHLLHLGAPLTTAQLCELARRAASFDQAASLRLLFEAGALLDTRLAGIAVRSYSAVCVALLLKLGPLPVDLSAVWFEQPGGGRQYTCPVLRVLRVGWNRNTIDTSPLRTLEALLAAGHKPTVYHIVRLEPGAQPVAAFDPLIERPLDFCSNSGANG
ncbi:hypothetical protein N2152v2_002928 [Parachlorella kessleri]